METQHRPICGVTLYHIQRVLLAAWHLTLLAWDSQVPDSLIGLDYALMQTAVGLFW